MKRHFLTAIVYVLATVATYAQNRNVVWVHGLGDNSNFWAPYATGFAQQRRIASNNQNYSTSNGIRTMAANVEGSTQRIAGAQTIGIGHSMGGVVLREIQAKINGGHVGGIITVGSPLNGARIVNTAQNGAFRAFISDGINELTKGPLREVFGLTYIVVRAATRAFTGRQLQEILLNEVSFDRIIMNQIGVSEQDLAEGSDYMNSARTYSAIVPKISIYGNENSPVHYRLASSTIGQADTYFPNIIRDARGVYNAFYVKNVATFFNIINISKAAGWKAGRDYLDEKSEKGWNNLIGATRTESSRSCQDVFVCSDYSCYDNIRTYEDYLACQQLCYQPQCRTYTTTYNQPSDGLLHQSTQTGQQTRGVTSNWNPNATFEALGSNHNEYDEHAGTQGVFNNIFDATDSRVPPFFRSLRR